MINNSQHGFPNQRSSLINLFDFYNYVLNIYETIRHNYLDLNKKK